jgi:glyoxylase-like metal-dependent hydrolase (beta-lactamase superfamily II)
LCCKNNRCLFVSNDFAAGCYPFPVTEAFFSPLSIAALDTRYLGIPDTASAFVVRGPAGHALVECGCAVAYEGLVEQLAALGLAPRDLSALFLTHIHLDHAGSAGHFAREGVPVFVHPRGVRHLAEPSRLIAGSRAVHGPRYERFYGDPLPIAPERLHAVEHGGVVEIAGLRFEAIETPGHARHHHAWLVGPSGDEAEILFTGDVLGMLSPRSTHISIPVPPSDIDIPQWAESLRRLRALPRELRAMLTHGGEVRLGAHIDAFVMRMNEELPLLEELVLLSATDEDAADARYHDFLASRASAAGLREELIEALLGKAFRAMNLAGIARAIEERTFDRRVE